MDSTWTYEHQFSGQYEYLESNENGYSAQRFSSSTPESPDALHIHRQFPDFWSNINPTPSPPASQRTGSTNLSTVSGVIPYSDRHDGEAQSGNLYTRPFHHTLPYSESPYTSYDVHVDRSEVLELHDQRTSVQTHSRTLHIIPREHASENHAASSGGRGTARNGLESRLRPVSELPDRFRGAFKFGVFNAIQSTCFDQVLHSEENLVISAPTGSGKTVLFELSMIRMLTQMSDDARAAKCVYVAPTKALCTEKYNEWTAKFGGLGIKCCELTGDTLLLGRGVWGDAKSSNIIVTTAEKWDSLTRNWADHSRILSQVKLFLVDEIHILNESRGSTLEVIISRMKARGSGIRFLLISATVPNAEDVACWIGSGNSADQPARIFQFGEEFRPCKLTKFVYSVAKPKGQNDFAYARTLDLRLFSIIQQHSTNKPILIFCATRKGTLDTAKQLANDYERAVKAKMSLPWPPPTRISHKFHDNDLTALASVGIAVHHAGLNTDDRKTVEDLYLRKALRVLVSTSTLAVGVNLPAQMVVIKGVKLYQNGEMKEYSDLDIMQMMGRAGRPQFDDEGIAIILCEPELEHKYRTLAQGNTTLESSLHRNLAEHINSEIGLGTISTIENAKGWLRHSFLFRRIQKNPHHYDIGKCEKQMWAEKIDDIVMQSILSLRDIQLITYNERDGRLSSTEYGDVMSKFYIRQETMRAILKLPASVSMREIFELVSISEEVLDLKLRSGEKQMYEKIRRHGDIRFPPKKVVNTSDKIVLLIQAILAGLPLSSPEFKPTEGQPFLEAISVFRHATRIITAVAEVAIINRNGAQLKHALELVRCLNAKAWEDRPLVLRQIDHIGEKSVKVLAENGVSTIQKLLHTSPLRIEELLNRRPPFGLEVLAAAKEFPRYYLDVKELRTIHSNGTSPVEVEFAIQCGLSGNSGPQRIKKLKWGKTEMTTLLIVTSDMVFIDFRRIATKALNEKKEFTLTAQLTKPSQSINVYIASETFAGVTISHTLVPTIPPSKYPTLETRPLTSVEMDLQGLEDVADFWDIDLDDDDDDDNNNKVIDSKASDCINEDLSKAHDSQLNSPTKQYAERDPKKRPDGKFECNHSCKNKSKCRHLCCQEGLLEAPRASKKKSQVANVDSNAVSVPSMESIVATGSIQGKRRKEAGGQTKPAGQSANLCEGASMARERPQGSKVTPNFDIQFATLKRSCSPTPSTVLSDDCCDELSLVSVVQKRDNTSLKIGPLPSPKRRRKGVVAGSLPAGALPSHKKTPILHKSPRSSIDRTHRLFLPSSSDDVVGYCGSTSAISDQVSCADKSFYNAPDPVVGQPPTNVRNTVQSASTQRSGEDADTHQILSCNSNGVTTPRISSSATPSTLKRNNSYALSPSRITGFVRRTQPYPGDDSAISDSTIDLHGPAVSHGRKFLESGIDSRTPVNSDNFKDVPMDDPLAEFDRWLASGAVEIVPD